MENRNDHLSSFLEGSPSQSPLIDPVDLLIPDLTCSICWEILQDPVSIECGHNFCANCITQHWDSGIPGSQPPRCPECRRTCNRSHTVADIRLRSLLEKMNFQHRTDSNQVYDGPNAEAVPLQLVEVNPSGDITVHLEVLHSCLNHPQTKNIPVCVISVVGEQRTGKSFLLNSLIQGFQGMKDPQWRKAGRIQQGFMCEPGPESVTKGLWIWSEPFILKSEDNFQVAVFFVDTEGTMSLEQDKEINGKLVALSMLLSSHQILNVSRMLKEADVEYLETSLHIAEEIGKHFQMEPMQHLDVLIRDWFYPATFGKEEGKKYIEDVIQKISREYPRVQETLEKKEACCYLLPFPGKEVASNGNGNTKDMDADFKKYLNTYITDVWCLATYHRKRHSDGHFLTGGELAEQFLKFYDLMKKRTFGFSSMVSMASQIHDMRVFEESKKELEDFVKEQDSFTKTMFAALKTIPGEMRNHLSTKKELILEHLNRTLKGPEKHHFMISFERDTQRMVDDFQKSYRSRFFGQTALLGGLIGGGVLAVAGGVVGVGVAATALAIESVVGATTAAVIGTGMGAGVGAGVGAGIGAAVGVAQDKGKVPQKKEDNVPLKDDE